MAASQHSIGSNTPLGATLVPGGATFRTWAPNAIEVCIAVKIPGGTARHSSHRNASVGNL